MYVKHHFHFDYIQADPRFYGRPTVEGILHVLALAYFEGQCSVLCEPHIEL